MTDERRSGVMYQGLYEDVVRFASEGELSEELQQARKEYVQLTGEMFESDPSFERRIAAFLEWYTLDRVLPAGAGVTPLEFYLQGPGATQEESDRSRLVALKNSHLSLFEFKRAKEDHMAVLDLLTNEKLSIYERRKPAGLEAGDILEARVVPYDDKLVFSEAYALHPRDARKAILKATKKFRKSDGSAAERLNLVHRVAFLANRCERYKHVSPKQIFLELEAQAA